MDFDRIEALLARVRGERGGSVPRAQAGRLGLSELEALSLLESLGLSTPRRLFFLGSREAAKGLAAVALSPEMAIRGDRAVVKVVSPEIRHKTEVGGVSIVQNEERAILGAIIDMEGRFAHAHVAGYSLCEFVEYQASFGRELLLGYRLSEDFGPLVSFGPGGIYAERLARAFRRGEGTLCFSPAVSDRSSVERDLSRSVAVDILSGGLRGTARSIELPALVGAVMAFLGAAESLARLGVLELEVNPLVVTGDGGAGCGRLVALDALATIEPEGDRAPADDGRRPVEKIDRLLRPESVAVAGASAKGMNNGRIILRNLLSGGIPHDHIYTVKPDAAELDGLPCYPSFSALPEKVDLAVIALPAQAAVEAIGDIARSGKAESVIVTTGGLEEKSGTELLVARMRDDLAASRLRLGGGPVINGGNCLGVRSLPGRYNTLFIPERKLPPPSGPASPVALVSQSGAFAVARLSGNPFLNPAYVVTCGNQMDLSVGDYLDRFAADASIELVALYVEGFKPGDGLKTLRAVSRIARSGRSALVYRAGRGEAGARASASHTASIAGDYEVAASLFAQAGAAVAESLEDFDDALSTFALLSGKAVPGSDPPRLGALSNAGFECVAMADGLGAPADAGRLELAAFSPETRSRLASILDAARIAGLVDVHNPLDLTPSAGDEAYLDSFRAVMEDPSVDCGILGIVPLSPAINTLAASPSSGGEDVGRPGSLVFRCAELFSSCEKPWVAVVDSGPLYDPLVHGLLAAGIPTFRTADRAMRALRLWLSIRRSGLAARGRAGD